MAVTFECCDKPRIHYLGGMNQFEMELELESLSQAAEALLKNFPNKKLYTFNAPMGAGKTTFIKAICQVLGYGGEVSSPTFPIINTYSTGSKNIVHIDCYRLQSEEEAIEAGIEEALFTADYAFVEWPHIIEQLLPPETVQVQIIPLESGKRQLLAQG